MIAAFIANGISLLGLVLLGWSVWMAVAIYWLENVLTLPVLAYRIRRAFPLLSAEELEAYLAARDGESTNGVSEGGRLRAVIAARGQAAAAAFAARRFLLFFGAFALGHGVFVFVLGIFSTSMAAGEAEAVPDISVFDGRALLLAALLILGGELLGLWLEREPAMPDVAGYTSRMIVLHVTIVIGAFVLTFFGGAALAVLFVGLKTLADLGVGSRARRAVARSARRA
jgi:hypothetical protein